MFYPRVPCGPPLGINCRSSSLWNAVPWRKVLFRPLQHCLLQVNVWLSYQLVNLSPSREMPSLLELLWHLKSGLWRTLFSATKSLFTNAPNTAWGAQVNFCQSAGRFSSSKETLLCTRESSFQSSRPRKSGNTLSCPCLTWTKRGGGHMPSYSEPGSMRHSELMPPETISFESSIFTGKSLCPTRFSVRPDQLIF